MIASSFSGCSSEDTTAAASRAESARAESSTVGIEPALFQCSTVAPLDQVASVLAGEVAEVATHFEPPHGVPRPCAYTRRFGEKQESWSFDMDCRPKALENAAKLMDQYRTQAAQVVEAAAAAKKAEADRPRKPEKKSGKPARKADKADKARADDPSAESPPEPATPIAANAETKEVSVGRSALDHHGQALIFIDDDAPCYVRINGPGEAGRLGLAELIAERLGPENAPTGRIMRK